MPPLARWMFILWLVAASVWGGPAPTTIVFHVWPADATIAVINGQQERVIGRAGEPLPRSAFPKGSRVRVTRQGFTPQTVELSPKHLERGRYPADGQVRLEGETAAAEVWYVIRGNWISLLATALVAALGVAGLVWFVRRRRLDSAVRGLDAMESQELNVAHLNEPDNLLGKTLAGYRLDERLAVGHAASVYRGVRVKGGKGAGPNIATIKVLQPRVAKDEVFRERFRREAKVAGQLQHPSMVRVLEWGEERGILYMVREHVEGTSLRQMQDSGPIPLETFRKVFSQVVEAVDYLHSRGYVHRNLKPENLVMTEQGVKLLDIGLIRSSAHAPATKQGMAVGTPAYKAPEQVAGRRLDTRSDQYSLGIIAYEMLTGKKPFEAPSAASYMYKHMMEVVPPLQTIRPDIPEALDVLVQTMMAKDPESRFPNLKEVLAALQAVPLPR